MKFDLKSYLRRINYTGEIAATFNVLTKVTEAHAKAIAFENIDAALSIPIQLSPETIFDKLVARNRGGYCFEQNGLLLWALESLGFDVKPVSGRVRLRFTDRSQVGPRTHVFLRVDIGKESFLTDVGMGSASLTGALKFIEDVEQETPHDTRRIVRDSNLWYHQVLYDGVWKDACEFTLEEMPPIDREIANWYTSTHPQSHFRDKLVAARARDNGERLSLENFDFTIRPKKGEAMKRKLLNHSELIDVLRNEFGLQLSDEVGARIKILPFLQC
jgi:N-hydroxyarylamine O-acetyltransferase